MPKLTPFPDEPLIDYDPRLHEFVESIAKQAKERQLGIAVAVASSTHCEFHTDPFPAWSCFSMEQRDGMQRLRIRAKASEDERLSSSGHVLFALRDSLAGMAVRIAELAVVVEKQLADHGVETEHFHCGTGKEETAQ